MQNYSDNNLPKNSNYKRQFFVNKINSKMVQNFKGILIEINLNFAKIHLSISNRENYTKFVLALINLQMLWLNLECLELFAYTYKFFRFFSLALHRLLNYFEKFFQQILKSSSSKAEVRPINDSN